MKQFIHKQVNDTMADGKQQPEQMNSEHIPEMKVAPHTHLMITEGMSD